MTPLTSYLRSHRSNVSKAARAKAKEKLLRRSRFESLETRQLLAAAIWNNATLPADVSNDADSSVTAADALLIINELNQRAVSDPVTGALPKQSDLSGRSNFFDVSGDGRVSALDALYVINHLKLQQNGIAPAPLPGRGGIHPELAGSPVIVEGTSLSSELSRDLVMPFADAALRVVFQEPSFDRSSLESIRDAFEIVVTDSSGNEILSSRSANGQSLFNWTEGLAFQAAPNAIVQSPQTGEDWSVTINLSELEVGTPLQVTTRLISNDGDGGSSVVFRGVEFVPATARALVDPPEPLTSPNRLEFDTHTLENVGNFFVADYGRTWFDASSNRLSTELSIINLGDVDIAGRMVVAIDGLDDSATELINPDGFLPDGRPFIDLTYELQAQPLQNGRTTLSRVIQFAQSQGANFDYGLEVYAQTSAVLGQLSTTPESEVTAGSTYRYAASVGDDDAEVVYSTVVAPEGFVWDSSSNEFVWTPSQDNVGQHIVIIRAEDSLRQFTEQSFTLSVRASSTSLAKALVAESDTMTSPFDSEASTAEGELSKKDKDKDDDGKGRDDDDDGHDDDDDEDDDEVPTLGGDVDEVFYFSVSSPSWLYDSDGKRVGVDDSDIVKLTNYTNGTWKHEKYLDGSDVGLSTSSEDIDAISIRDDGSILISTSGYGRVDGVGSFSGEDVLLFQPTSLGEMTKGTWSLYVDGSDVGLSCWENVDAISELADGRLVLSTSRTARVNGLNYYVQDEDLIALTLTSTGQQTAGTWEVFFDGSDALLQHPYENIDGVSVDRNGKAIHLSTWKHIRVPDFRGDGRDIITFDADSLGAVTTGQFRDALTLDGSHRGLRSGWIDAISFYESAVTQPQPPVLIAIDDQSVAELTTLTLTASATDVDTPVDQLRYSILSGPSGAIIDPVTGVFTWRPTEVQGPGTFSVTVQVTDGELTGDETFTIEVSEVNRRPTITAIPDQTIVEGVPFEYQVVATDPDRPNNNLTFSLVGTLPTGIAITPAGLITWTPSDAQGPGSYAVRVRVTDDGTPSLFHQVIANITVNEDNLAPVITPIGNQSVAEGTTLELTVTATDGDTPVDQLRYSLLSHPTGATIDPVTGIFSWRPSEVQGPDTFSITVQVTDGELTGDETFTVEVSEVNRRPTITAIPDQSIVEGVPFEYQVVATDLDRPNNNLTFSLVGALPTGIAITPTGLVTWTPGDAQGLATYAVRVRVTDDGTPNLFHQVIANITVNEDNLAPVITPIGNQSVAEGTTLELTVTATDGDTPVDQLRYSLLSRPTGATIDPVTGVFNWRPSEIQGPGTFSIAVQVTDGELTGEETFTVEVSEVNRRPTITAIPDQSIVEGVPFEYQAVATDPDRPNNNLTFSLVGARPTGIDITPTGLITWTPSEAQGPGTYTVRVRVTDDGTPSLFHTVVVSITVNDNNQAPVITAIPDQSIGEGILFQYQVDAIDPDGPTDTLTYSFNGTTPSGIAIDANGLITWTPTETQGPGVYTITVKVSDSGSPSLSATDTFVLTVDEMNQAPTLTAIPDQTIEDGVLFQYQVIAIDPDIPANQLTYSFDSSPINARIDSQTGLISWTPNGATTETFTVRVTDDGSPALSATEAFAVVVQPVADGTIIVTEGTFAQEKTFPIELGQAEGTRSLRFRLDTQFDRSDSTTEVGDVFAVYVVDSLDATQTLLNRGAPGTAIFAMSESGMLEMATGLVQFNGQYITVDLSSLGALTGATVRLQLLSHDADSASRITVSEVSNTLDPEGVSSPVLPYEPIVSPAGAPLNYEALTASSNVSVELENIRFDLASGLYTAELNLNAIANVGRSAAVSFPGLPVGVQLLNASGTNASGVPYLNLLPATPAGGLRANHPTAKVLLQFSVAPNTPLMLTPEIVVGLPNRAPVISPIAPASTTPGDALVIPINVTDPDGDRVTLSIRALSGTPTLTLRADNTLLVSPRPDEIGTYQFALIASDGELQTSQPIEITVAEDPVKTTRISGVVLNTNNEPLAGIPVELGRHRAVTGANGAFTIELPSFETPTEVFDIVVPTGDPQFDPFAEGDNTISLFRAGFDATTGTSTNNPRLHTNIVSSFIDASTIYGSDANRAAALRTFDGSGKLKTSAGNLLPVNDATTFPTGVLENENNSQFDPSTLFAAGDVRANENVALISLHTLLVREHNRKADEIFAANPTFTDEQIYQDSRRWVTAVIQQITYNEFLPLLLGSAAIPAYSGYDASVNPSVSGLFSAAAFRFGHSVSVSEFNRLDAAGLPTADGPISIREAFFNADAVKDDGIETYFRGMASQVLEELDTTVVNQLRNFLFGPPGAGGLDLVSLNIQRGRDLGLPSYNQARRDMGLAPVASFAQISSDINVQSALASVYASVDDIDIWVGGLAEDHVAGAMVGQLFQAIIADQFVRLRNADRFWFENSQFTASELASLRTETISKLIVRNTSIDSLPVNAFTTSTPPTGFGGGGSAATAAPGEYRSLDGSGNNTASPSLGQTGTNLLTNYTLEYSDGISSPAGADRVSARQISNSVFGGPSGQVNSLGATNLFAIWGQILTHDTNLSPGGTDNTLKIFGDLEPSADAYPFVAEKLPLLLENPIYISADNVIARPIYLPVLNTADAVTIDPNVDTTVTVAISAGFAPATVFVQAGTLQDRQGSLFAGQLSITEVPTSLTPASLPAGLLPDTVVTIQPGNMVFTTPAPLTLPNRAGMPAGFEVDLWSIDPNTGDFEIVGSGLVSADESVIETTEGGIRNSSWHFFIPRFVQPTFVPTDSNPEEGCDPCEVSFAGTSTVNAHSGEVVESHSLPSYESLGQSRGVQLVYNSLRADPRHIVHSNFTSDIRLSPFLGRFTVIGSLSVTGQGLTTISERNYWGTGSGQQDLALLSDLSGRATGVYNYAMSAGMFLAPLVPGGQTVGVGAQTTGRIVHINSIDSAFGSGWDLAGLQYLVENEDGSVLLVDGDGSETVFELAADRSSYDSPPGHFTTLAKVPDGSFTLTTTDKTISTFDDENRLVSVVDRNGNQTVYEYSNGLLTSITDPVGLVTTFNYNAGKVSSIVDPANRLTQFDYDASGNLTRVTDPDGTTRTWEYDDAHHIVSEVDKRGFNESMQYDFAGRAQQATRKDGSVLQYRPAQVQGLYPPELTLSPSTAPRTQPSGGTFSTFVDGNGNVYQVELTSSGQSLGSQDGAGSLGTSRYNDEILPVLTTDARGFETAYAYDANGNVITILDSISSGGGAGGFTFGAPSVLISPFVSNDFWSGDLNGDGQFDVITGQTVYLNNGSGGFQPGIPLVFNSFNPTMYEVADLNGDGLKDIVGSFFGTVADGGVDQTFAAATFSGFASAAFNQAVAERLHVWLANVDGTFADAVSYSTGSTDENVLQPGLVLADFNNDSYPDVVLTQPVGAAGASGSALLLFVNDGSGGLLPGTTIIPDPSNPAHVPPNAWKIKAADLNSDGNQDVVITSTRNGAATNSHVVTVLLGDGAGGFGLPTNFDLGFSDNGLISTELENDFVQLADLNNDGSLDAVVASTLLGQVSIVLGNGGGGFGAPNIIASELFDPTGSSVFWTAMTAADFDGDSNVDVALTLLSTNSMVVLSGNGDGSFAPRADYKFDAGNFDQFSSRADGLYATDFDSDGILDLLTAGTRGDDISYLRGNADGTFLSWDSLSLGAGSANAPAQVDAVDLDGDGKLDLVTRSTQMGAEVRFGLGDRLFSDPVALLTPVNGQFSSSMVFLDADSNGTLDFFIEVNDSTFSQPERYYLFSNLGNRSFANPVSYNFGIPGGGAMVTGDFNNDSVDDLLLMNVDGGVQGVRVAFGDGMGGFVHSPIVPLPQGLGDIGTGDVDNDGNLDLIVTNHFDSISVYRGDGAGGFTGGVDYSVEPRSVAIGDLNSDGFVDLAFVGFDSQANVEDAGYFLNDGTGQFGTPIFLGIGSNPRSFFIRDALEIVIGDFNADSLADLVVSSPTHYHVTAGIPGGGFTGVTSFRGGSDDEIGLTSYVTAIADLDSDGTADIVGLRSVFSGNDNTITIHYGEQLTQLSPRLFTYDPVFNQLTSITDELGRQTFFEIDPANGNTLSITQVIGLPDATSSETDDLVTQYSYLVNGLVDQMIDPLGRVTQYQYNAIGLTASVTMAAGTLDVGTLTFIYDTAGNVIELVDPNLNRSTFAYDELNRLISSTDPILATSTFDYDNAGNLIQSIDRAGSTMSYEYDRLSRVVRKTDEQLNLTQFAYDQYGNLTSMIDPLGQEMRYTYDARNRQRTQIDPDGGVTRFLYDADDNLTTLVDPVGNRTLFLYDARNRLISEVDPLNERLLYDYDLVDNLVEKTDRNGRVTEFTYDDVDRLTTETWLAANASVVNTIDYVYDKASNLFSVSDVFSSLAWTYDARDRAITESNVGTPGAPEVQLAYTYDAVGNVLSVTDTINGTVGAATSYLYDALNRMQRVSQTASGGLPVADKRVDIAYNAIGQFAAITRYSDLAGLQLVVDTTYQYDSLNRLERLAHVNATSTVAFYDYTYDGESRITSITDIDGITSYTYDDRDQLTGADHADADNPDETYEYDANGNRIDSHLHDNGYVTGPANRLLSDGTYNYGYDAEGNRILQTNIATGDYRQFEYDHRNRLFAVIDFSSSDVEQQRVEFVYDAINRRIAKSTDDAITHFVYEGNDVLLDFIDSDGIEGNAPQLAQRYLHGPLIDQVFAQESDVGDVSWILSDALGSTRDLVNDMGQVLNHMVYDSFGNITFQTNSSESIRYLFTGREYDPETELMFYRSRFYDPLLGRFLTEDTIGFAGSLFNLYHYVDNSPNNFVDPLGNEPEIGGTGPIELSNLTPDQLQSFLKELKEQGIEIVTVGSKVNTCGGVGEIIGPEDPKDLKNRPTIDGRPIATVGDNAESLTDAHGCPACPHPVVGPVISGLPNVLLNGKPVATTESSGITSACCGPNSFSIK